MRAHEFINESLDNSKITDSTGNLLTVYHGSPSQFSKFDQYSTMDGGFYFTDDRRVAASFAKDEDGETGHIIAAHLDIQNPKLIDLGSKQQPSQEKMQELFDRLKSSGYDGAILHNVLEFNGPGTQYVAFNPDQIHIISENLDEMALKQYQPVGKFDANGPLKGADRPLATHPAHIQKVEQFFERTPYDFRIFVSNLPGLTKYKESGAKTPEQINQMFAKDKNYQEVATQVLADTENAITIIYLGNYGDAKVLLTPWVMAHRLGHAITATNRGSMGGSGGGTDSWSQAERYFFKTINTLLSQHYGKSAKDPYSGANVKWDLTPEYNALFNSIGTQRSSRKGLIKRPYEFMYELFAQYIKDGTITLNPLPVSLDYGRKAWGRPTKYMRINPEYTDEGTRQQESDRLASTLTTMFNDVMRDCVGKVFVM